LISSREAAELLSLHPTTLQQWRLMGIGPAWVRVGTNRIRYRVSDLVKFVEENQSIGTINTEQPKS
jgi:hypothetical protein